MTYQLHHGDCINIMPLIERESVDAIVTDPPYGLGFMGKDWDHGVPGMHFWLEALRCAKPGAYLLAFGGTRTFHRLTVAIEDAGWEIRDTVMWVYGQGFPKSHDVSKAIDREAGAEREVIGKRKAPGMAKTNVIQGAQNRSIYEFDETSDEPATPAAAEWDGWGTALKPAWEPIIVARKPLQGTVAENVQRYGTGAMNIDQCRIGNDEITIKRHEGYNSNSLVESTVGKWTGKKDIVTGRWPANLIHDGSAEVLAGFPVTTNKGHFPINGKIGSTGIYGSFNGTGNSEDRYTSDTGSAARFFYCAKASKADRDEGCDELEEKEWTLQGRAGNADLERGEYKSKDLGRGGTVGGVSRNHHPTVKPTALMRYLCRLVTPPGGVILDPFMGSGSTGKAAMLEGFNFIGIDTEIEYVEIAARRIEHACEKVGIVIEQPMMFETKRETVNSPKQLMLL